MQHNHVLPQQLCKLSLQEDALFSSTINAAQAFCDLEAFYTYEGTYDVNVLVAGRGQTGVAAIKAPSAAKANKALAGAQA